MLYTILVTACLSVYRGTFRNCLRSPKLTHTPTDTSVFSLLGALINSVVLLVGSIIILVNAVPRLLDPQQPHTKGMLILAVFGVIINGLAVFRLQHGKSINERVVSLHLLEDVLGWVAVLIGATVMHFVNAPIIDPILSIAITIYILSNVFKNLKQSMRIILQGSPLKIEADQVEKILLSHPDIQDIHDLHIWSIDGEYNILTAHLVLKHTEITYPQRSKD
jgi:cobalt-zinc-cadmium efflux system protein